MSANNTPIEVGQVLSLRIYFNTRGTVSQYKHPYLVVAVDDTLNTIEIAQIDSIKPETRYKAAFRTNKVVLANNPRETVIDKDSFVQLDNRFSVENFPELARYRRQSDKLSLDKLSAVLTAYFEYHANNTILEEKIVLMTKQDILALN